MPSSLVQYLFTERSEVLRANQRIKDTGYVETDATAIFMLVKELDGGREKSGGGRPYTLNLVVIPERQSRCTIRKDVLAERSIEFRSRRWQSKAECPLMELACHSREME